MEKYIVLVIVVMRLTLTASCDDLECKPLLEKYRIDKDIKTNKGWVRVCANNKLFIYTTRKVSVLDYKDLCECLSLDKSLNRSIENYNRGKQ